jgi:hypothetical protein
MNRIYDPVILSREQWDNISSFIKDLSLMFDVESNINKDHLDLLFSKIINLEVLSTKIDCDRAERLRQNLEYIHAYLEELIGYNIPLTQDGLLQDVKNFIERDERGRQCTTKE